MNKFAHGDIIITRGVGQNTRKGFSYYVGIYYIILVIFLSKIMIFLRLLL